MIWGEEIEQRLKSFLLNNEYDTDAFINDMAENKMQSNLFPIIKQYEDTEYRNSSLLKRNVQHHRGISFTDSFHLYPQNMPTNNITKKKNSYVIDVRLL